MSDFPVSFFDRSDAAPDSAFYDWPRLVTHVDDAAIAGIGALYAELGLSGRVLDLMSSWVSHFTVEPAELVVLGMNADELARNPMASEWLVHDLNDDPSLPYPDRSFDAVTCAVSIDYLTRPVEVLREVARVLRPAGPVVVTFSNRCFPSKAVRGWLEADDAGRVVIVTRYLRAAGGFEAPEVRRPSTERGDPLFAVLARRSR